MEHMGTDMVLEYRFRLVAVEQLTLILSLFLITTIYLTAKIKRSTVALG